jgi:hypothetical protein
MANAEHQAHNLRLAVIGCVVVSMICALTVYLTADFILASFRSTEALVMLITDAGIRSDDKTLERNLSSATLALGTCRDICLALFLGCCLIGGALAVKLMGWAERSGKANGKD